MNKERNYGKAMFIPLKVSIGVLSVGPKEIYNRSKKSGTLESVKNKFRNDVRELFKNHPFLASTLIAIFLPPSDLDHH